MARSKSPRPDTWMPLYVGDYLADTIALSCEEHGAYFLLLMDYWRRQGPLPDDDVKLARIVRLPMKRWLVLRPSIAEFFQTAGAEWHHRRVDREISNAAEMYQRQCDRTKAATATRRQRNDERNDERNGLSTLSQPQPQPQPQSRAAQHLLPSTLPRDASNLAQSAAPLVNEKSAEIIAAFDRACKAAWPENHRSFPTGTDAVIAMRWAEAGADPSLVEATAGAVFRKRASKGGACPTSLAYLDEPIREAISARRNGGSSSGHARQSNGYQGPVLTEEVEKYLADQDARAAKSKAGATS